MKKNLCSNCFTCVKNTVHCPLHPDYSELRSHAYWTEKLLGITKESDKQPPAPNQQEKP